MPCWTSAYDPRLNQTLIQWSWTNKLPIFDASDSVYFIYFDPGDQGGTSGEDIQLTTTITHADGPTEVYRMMGKESQE